MAPPPEEQPHIGTMGRIGQEQEISWRNFICLSSHPVAAFFHLVSAPFRPRPLVDELSLGDSVSVPRVIPPLPLATPNSQAFKASAIVLYVFSNWFGFDFVTAFVLVILLLAFDFWVVKVRRQGAPLLSQESLQSSPPPLRCRTSLGGCSSACGGG